MAYFRRTFHRSVGVAERDLREEEVVHSIVDHRLDKGDCASEAVHKSNEWIIFGKGSGKFEITIDRCSEIIELDPKRAMVIAVPAGKRHSFLALTDLFYTVLKDNPRKASR